MAKHAEVNVVEAAEAKKLAARKARKEAYLAKRAVRFIDLQKSDPDRIPTLYNFREFKSFLAAHPETKLADGKKLEANWAGFCTFKAVAFHSYWMKKATKPQVSEKSLERKKAQAEKTMAKLAKIQAELKALGIEMPAAK